MNRLANETSPYLLQHQHNPVDWYPWGEAALKRAKDENKVIFLSIGYAACHWCHVMERESFENPEIAKKLNEYFVCIKVDREERPDLDEIYMAAVTAMTGHGGWPMSVWMTPSLKPFYTGTYFPPEDKNGMPGFPRVVEHVQKLWTERAQEIEEYSENVASHLREALAPKAEPDAPALDMIAKAAEQSWSRYDQAHGGFARPPRYAPKFPHASELTMLLRHHARTGSENALQSATTTLRKMAEGGMYDQLGGGFHRYSVDRVWLAPHFEKMLYDNSLLTRANLEAYAATGDPFYQRIAKETLDYLLREMQDEAGGFYSTQDADSEGVEGKFFVWDQAEIEQLLGDDAKAFGRYYGVREGGNWEEHNILHVAKTEADAAKAADLEIEPFRELLARSRQKLFEARAKRVHPGTDDKVLAAWNGMAIAACALGYQSTGDERYLTAARRAADFVLREMRRKGRLLRTWRKGRAQLMAYVEDYGFLADGLLCLFEADFDPRWLREAKALLDAAREHFLDESDGNFFFTADDHEQLITRTKSVNESSIPSGVAMVVQAALRAGLLLGDEALYHTGLAALRANHKHLSEIPIGCTSLVLSVDFALGDPKEVVIAGDPNDPRTRALLAAARAAYPPHRVIAVVHDGNREALEQLSEIFTGKLPVDGQPAAYVCRRGVCDAPVTSPAELAK